MLAAFFGYLGPWERAAHHSALAALPGFLSSRTKLPSLRHDLIALGVQPGRIDDLPSCPNVPSLQQPGFAFGSAYVIEGSTLGSQLLSRHFHRQLAIAPSNGGAYFHGYGDRTGSMWKEFKLLASAEITEESALTQALTGARQTFETMHRWLTRHAAVEQTSA